MTGSDRVYHGEGVISYSQRHAARNHSDIADIEHGIRQRGVRLPKTRLSPERLEVWRQLGSLHHPRSAPRLRLPAAS